MDLDQEQARIVAVLAQRHPVFAEQTIARLVARTFRQFRSATVTTFLPILVQLEVEAQLSALDRDFPGS
jgi:hypothetical protein